MIVHDDDGVPCPRTNLVGGGNGASSILSCAGLKAKTTIMYDSPSAAFATSLNVAGPGGTASLFEPTSFDVMTMVGMVALDVWDGSSIGR